jgi:hypothetical protein
VVGLTRPDPHERFAWAVEDLCRNLSASATNGGTSVWVDSDYEDQIVSLHTLAEVVRSYDVVWTDGSVSGNSVMLRFVSADRLRDE